MVHDRKPRLLVFVIAYYAEATLTAGPRAHPARRSSATTTARSWSSTTPPSDRTYEIGRAYRRAHPEIADDGAAQRVQPGLRRQPEGRLRVRHRARGSTSWRWSTATGSTRRRSCPTLVAPLRDGRGRRRVRQPHDDPVRRAARAACRSTSSWATGSSARVQNLLLRHQPDRVPQRLPRLLGGGAAADPLPAELERLSTSTPRSSSSC